MSSKYRYSYGYEDVMRENAMRSDESGQRGWDFSVVPAEPKAPASVRIVTAAILMIGVLSFFGFAIARAVL